MDVILFIKPDDSVAVLKPVSPPAPGQSQTDWLDERRARHIANHPEYSAYTYSYVDDNTLPAYERPDTQGDPEQVRNAWRYDAVAESVVIDEPSVETNWAYIVPRMLAGVSAETLVELAGVVVLFQQAVAGRNVPMMQAVYDGLKEQQAGLTPPFTAGEWAHIQATLTAKHTPIVL